MALTRPGWLALAAAGCGAADLARGPAGPATCELAADNTLRASCRVELAAPGPVDLAFEPLTSGPVRAGGSTSRRLRHELIVSLLSPDTTYRWTAWSGSALAGRGELTTGRPPPGADLELRVRGESTADLVAFRSPCGGAMAVAADPSGTVVWYQDLDPDGLGLALQALSVTPEGTLLALVSDPDRDGTLARVVEVDLAGRERMRLDRRVGLEGRPHHDLARREDLTYLLVTDPIPWDGGTYLLDAVEIVDPEGAVVGSWRLADIYRPHLEAGFTGGDPSHANGLWVDAEGTAVVSFRNLSTVVAIRADPDAADFGAVIWRLAGEPGSAPLGTDFALREGADFALQHNPHLLDPGTLALFDNRGSRDEDSRLLTLALDPERATADLVEAYDLGQHCDIQGGAWFTPAGAPLATCAPSRLAAEFPRGGADRSWELTATCASGDSTWVPRFVPWGPSAGRNGGSEVHPVTW